MADLPNPFSQDGTFKNAKLAIGDVDVDDDDITTEEAGIDNGATIDGFLRAVHDLLKFADQRYCVRAVERGKKPELRIRKKLQTFEKELGPDVPDSKRHTLGELAIRQYHDVMSDYYQAIADDDDSVVEGIEHPLLDDTGLKEKWIKAGPNVRSVFMLKFKKINTLANAFFLGISLEDNVSSATVDKLKNSKAVGVMMGALKEGMKKVQEELSPAEIQEVMAAGMNMDMIKSVVSMVSSNKMDLNSIISSIGGTANAESGAGGGSK
jgi:hypothetical protein